MQCHLNDDSPEIVISSHDCRWIIKGNERNQLLNVVFERETSASVYLQLVPQHNQRFLPVLQGAPASLNRSFLSEILHAMGLKDLKTYPERKRPCVYETAQRLEALEMAMRSLPDSCVQNIARFSLLTGALNDLFATQGAPPKILEWS